MFGISPPSQFPLDWYWLADDGRLFSSSRQITVSVTDEQYITWLLNGFTATVWPRDTEGEQTSASLQEVIGQYGLWVVLEDSLENYKTVLCSNIDTAAEAERSKYSTPGAGQALTYWAKTAEAKDFLASGSGTYPLLTAEIGITAESLTAVAEAVITAYEAWTTIGAQIEAARLGAKKNIRSATNREAADAAASAVTWP